MAGGDLKVDSLAASIVEVSVVFATVNLVTGSIWARVEWGIWWTWDYRLTSQLVCVLIFAGYLIMRRAIDEPTQRARLSAALTIFGCFNAVIVWKSIEWFRNNHPGPVLSFRTGGEQRIDPGMEHELFLNALSAADCGRRFDVGSRPPGIHRSRNRFSTPCRARLKGYFMDARNFTFMFYGFLAAWLIVLVYVVSLARRGARLTKELEDVKQLVASGQKS